MSILIFWNVVFPEVMNGRLETSKMFTLSFSEFEACVATIITKVKEADSQGNEIIDSEGTRGELGLITVYCYSNCSAKS